MRSLGLATVLLMTLGGCGLYFGNGDDDCHAAYESVPQQVLRDPQTGNCVAVGGGGGCNSACGPCAYGADQPPSGGALAIWAVCYGSCEGLDESTCLSTATCHVAYWDSPSPNSPPTTMNGREFRGCWEVPPYGPIDSGGCAGLDATTCSEHDDCASVYGRAADAINDGGVFHQCIDESTTNGCDSTTCDPGSHCEQNCYPCDSQDGQGCPAICYPMCIPDHLCDTIDCGPGSTCVETCTGMIANGICTAQCVAVENDPGSCTGPVVCDAVGPHCPANTTAGIANGCYTGYCIPNADCGQTNPGTCEPATCALAPPHCPSGTTAGTESGCYTGYCIPNNDCPVVMCEGLTTSAACIGRMDCSPVYQGFNCTCDPNGCTCLDETYERCETRGLL